MPCEGKTFLVKGQQNMQSNSLLSTPYSLMINNNNLFLTPPNAQQQPRGTVYQTYRAKSANILGWLQLAAGMLSVILAFAGTVAKANNHRYYNFAYQVAPGIWCGSFVRIVIVRVTLENKGGFPWAIR